MVTDSGTYTFRVVYPHNYNQEKEYKCFIGLSGGGQSVRIVDYCYAAWFRSGYFNDYITILPVASSDSANLRDYTTEEIEALLDIIEQNFLVNPNYLIAGTSNGGYAAFNFVAAFPERFEGIIVAPGILSADHEPTKEWKHLKVILAYGSLDDESWIKETKNTEKRIKKSVKAVQRVVLQGQGHILSISFNADKMYDPYFLGE